MQLCPLVLFKILVALVEARGITNQTKSAIRRHFRYHRIPRNPTPIITCIITLWPEEVQHQVALTPHGKMSSKVPWMTSQEGRRSEMMTQINPNSQKRIIFKWIRTFFGPMMILNHPSFASPTGLYWVLFLLYRNPLWVIEMGYNSTYRYDFTPSYLTKPRYKSPGDISPLCEGYFTTVLHVFSAIYRGPPMSLPGSILGVFLLPTPSHSCCSSPDFQW